MRHAPRKGERPGIYNPPFQSRPPRAKWGWFSCARPDIIPGLLTPFADDSLRAVLRRHALVFLALSLALRVQAGPTGLLGAPEPAPNLVPPVITATEVDTDFNGDSDAVGAVVWRQDLLQVTADAMHYQRSGNVVSARGHVTMTQGEERLLADTVEFHRSDGSFTARNVRLTPRYPIVIQGSSAEGHGREIIIHDAIVTYTDPGSWKPSIKARTVIYEQGHYLRMVRSMVGLSGLEIVPLGSVGEKLNQAVSESILSFYAGYRSFLGASVGAGLHDPVFEDGRIGGDAEWYSKHGFLAGPAASYINPAEDVTDTLRTGFIQDHGQRLDDVLGNPIPADRGYATWQHQQDWDNGWSLNADVNWWKDSDVIRDFDPKQFYPVQTPDNFLEALYAGQNDFAWVFARLRPDSFIDAQGRLPEVGYAVAPVAIGGGFYERLSASAADLAETPPTGGPKLSEERLDAFYGLSRPVALSPWATFTPVAGARITDYLDTQGAVNDGSYLRALGELGFDAVAHASGTFDYTNPTWDIAGLRHLLTPEITYRYIPDAAAGQDRIPEIDRQTFTTYLTPLELGDVRNLDQLEPENTLRLGLDNILQTRDAGYGSRNLVNLNVADDLNFTRTANEPDFSDLHTELAVTPAHWLEFDLGQVFSPRTLNQREFDSSLILRDADLWTLQIANDFLKHEDNAYLLNATLRITEQFQALLFLEYDARTHIFGQRAIGLVQNLVNTWRVEYLLTLNGGPNREGRLGFQMEVDVFRF